MMLQNHHYTSILNLQVYILFSAQENVNIQLFLVIALDHYVLVVLINKIPILD